MTRVEGLDKALSITARGAFGRSSGYGAAKHGNAPYGLLEPLYGIYQRHRASDGWCTSRMAFYRPTNTQKPAQQAWRGIFAAGVTQYHSLTALERRVLFQKARTRGMTGFNLFMSHWLQSRRA